MTSPLSVVLAGGVNSRFWPLREKSLLPLHGQSLLRRHLALLAACGVPNGIVVGTSENAEQLAAEAAQVTAPRMRVVIQPEARGMGDAVLRALDAAGDLGGRPLLVTQVHDLFDGDLLGRLVEANRSDPDRSYLAAYRARQYFPGGYYELQDGRPVGLLEKPGPGNEPSDLVAIVAHLHRDPSALAQAIRAAYAVGGPDDHYERAITALMRAHEHALTVHHGAWAAIKYPWHVLDAMDLLLGQCREPVIAADAQVDPRASVNGPVVIESGVRLFAGACVAGPAYIGRGTIVGNNALVRQSCIEERCVVGFGSEVARSYVGPGCWFHTNYVGDSVIGPGSSFGAGGVTANLRQDHRGVRSVVRGERLDTGRDKLGLVCGAHASFGVQVATMPGVKVGQGSVVGPGIVLYHDVPDGRRLLLRQEVQDLPLR